MTVVVSRYKYDYLVLYVNSKILIKHITGADLGGFLGFPETPWRLDLLQKSTPALKQQI